MVTSTSALASYLIPVMFAAGPGRASISYDIVRYSNSEHAPIGTHGGGAITASNAVRRGDAASRPLTGPTHSASWLATSTQKILSYGNVIDGWKGEGSIAPTGAAIAEACDLLEQFAFEAPTLSRPMISADEEGTICLYWRDGEMLATVSVYGDGTYSFYAEGHSDPARSDAEPVNTPLPMSLLVTMIKPEAPRPTA